jgi:hypothetical protein
MREILHLSATAAIAALLCNAIAIAQPAPPAAQPGETQADPPSRVGRIARESGAVSFRTQADTQWTAATVNYPVSSGNAFWTEPSAQAELEISASRVALAGQTDFEVTTLDDSGLQAVAAQGEVYVHTVDLAPNEAWTVQTPRGAVRVTGPGRYDIVAGTTEQPTVVTVLEGSAEIDGPGIALTIAANQTATITGSDPFLGGVGPAAPDAFLSAMVAQDRQQARPVPSQLATIPGASDLSGIGQWSQTPDYGQVWYPPVAQDWAPYQDGQWAYVAPWGWTWIDAAPWGFAPFHYGRWALIGGRWGWVAPGPVASVYAPALVTFLGLSAGAAVLANASVGWVPLGPHEAYHPWYHASSAYERQINRPGAAAINGRIDVNTLVNRGAAVSVPVSVMTASRPLHGEIRPVPAESFAAAHAVIGQQPIRPTAATAGVTPAVAWRLDLAETGAPGRPAPGPVVQAQTAGPANGRPPLPGPHGEPQAAPHPGAAPGPGTHAPGTIRPAQTPGERPAGLPAVQRPEIRPESAAHPELNRVPAEHPAPIERRTQEARPVEPAQREAPPPARVEERAPPRLTAPLPRVEQPRPPPPRVEPPRPQAPPARAEPERKPGER